MVDVTWFSTDLLGAMGEIEKELRHLGKCRRDLVSVFHPPIPCSAILIVSRASSPHILVQLPRMKIATLCRTVELMFCILRGALK